jgi:hypothetical protein
MPDQSMTVLWLLAGGLVVVSMALGVVGTAYVQLRRSLSRNAATDPKGARRTAIGALAAHSGPAMTKTDVTAALREEWGVFQAVYRADLAQILAEIRGEPTLTAQPGATPPGGIDRLDQAIALARAGHGADVIVRACALDPADAEALVRFHGPDRAAGLSAGR